MPLLFHCVLCERCTCWRFAELTICNGDLLGDVISIVSGFDEYWIEMKRLERIIGLVEGRWSEKRTRSVQGKSIVKWDFIIEEYCGGIRMAKIVSFEMSFQLIIHRSPSKALTPHETTDQKSEEKNPSTTPANKSARQSL